MPSVLRQNGLYAKLTPVRITSCFSVRAAECLGLYPSSVFVKCGLILRLQGMYGTHNSGRWSEFFL
jgi:hypothetical protein